MKTLLQRLLPAARSANTQHPSHAPAANTVSSPLRTAKLRREVDDDAIGLAGSAAIQVEEIEFDPRLFGLK